MSFVLFHFLWGHMFARNDVGVQEFESSYFSHCHPLSNFTLPTTSLVCWCSLEENHLCAPFLTLPEEHSQQYHIISAEGARPMPYLWYTQERRSTYKKNCSGSLQRYSTLLQHWWDSLLSGNCPGFNYSCSPHGYLWNATLSSSHTCVKIVI